MKRRFAALLVSMLPWLMGFDLSRHSVPPDEILGGGPPKDGIPAILNPKFVSADQATYLGDGDRVIGVVRKGVAKAYPLRILTWHEVVDDSVADRGVAVTYCPLTGSAIVYDRKVDGRDLTFGISGKLYQSNVLLYDKQTDSLWSQLKEEAVAGAMTGKRLTALPSVVTSWGRWRSDHPTTLVLSRDTGYTRPYDRNPYEGYAESDGLMFPPSRVDRRLPPKERVVGLESGGAAMALPLSRLARTKTPVEVRLGGTTITVRYDSASQTAEAFTGGAPTPAFTGYWFAWYAFHPETGIWPDVSPGAANHEVPADHGDSRIVILEHQGRWSSLTGFSEMSGGLGDDERGSFYLISGKLRNDSPTEVSFVRIGYDLLDDRGEVVAREWGYNRGAEALRDSKVESGETSPAGGAVRSLPSGADDGFRMFFFRDELPKFARYRVRVEKVGAARGQAR